jgi:hypothetical protein
VSDYRLVERVPLVEDYNRVRTEAGLSGRDRAAAKVGLPNILFGVCVESDERVVGIGRIIGDGGLFFRSWTSPSWRSTREKDSGRWSWTP